LSIAATKAVDCSFVKAEHSTQVSSKNNSRKSTCIAKQFAAPPPVSQSCHLPFVKQSQVLAHLYCLQRSVLPSKTLFLKAVKQLRCFFFCFRVLFYRINTHALKNAFQLQNNSKFICMDWLGFCSLPKIPKLIYFNGFAALIKYIFFLKLSKCLNPCLNNDN
jgi:hypothetical protein